MTRTSRMDYFEQILPRYLESEKEEKGKILDEYCEVCGYNRKYAIRLLNKKPYLKSDKTERRGRPNEYNTDSIRKYLITVWKVTNLICSKRMKAILTQWLPYYESRYGRLEEIERGLIERISPKTIDRILKPCRTKYGKRGLSTTRPGSIIKQMIPIKTSQWDETRPGFFEADTVAHCGGSISGNFGYTVNLVDIATGWSIQRAILGKGEYGVLNVLQQIETVLPFKILGFDSDNGNEFINWPILKYFRHRTRPVEYTRSRPYGKNDNAHIEEKNWTIVRQYFGYRRIETPKAVARMNKLYSNELYYFLNYFIPSMKLIDKQRIGSKIIKHHDNPQTPYARLMQSGYINKEIKRELKTKQQELEPFKLQLEITKQIKEIFTMSSK
jgi:hypothetical protein